MNDYKRKLDEKFGPSDTAEWNFYDDLQTLDSGVDSQTAVVLEREFAAICPTDGHEDVYHLTADYDPSGGRVLEIESFSDWLDAFGDTEAPQEAWCNFICHALWVVLRPERLRVEVVGEHYGVETTVHKERTRE